MAHRPSVAHLSRRSGKKSLPFVTPSAEVGMLFGVGALAGLFTPNPFLTAGALLLVPLLIRLLWRRQEAPVLLFAALYQWGQVTAQLFYANFSGVPLGTFIRFSHVKTATALGLIGLLVLILGMHLPLRRLGANYPASEGIERFSLWRLFVLYVALAIYGQLISVLGGLFGPLSQILIPAAKVRWVIFFILSYVCIQRSSGYKYMAVAATLEFIQGIGYFSGFKIVIFYLIIVAFTGYERVSVRSTVIAGTFFLVLMGLGSVWTSIEDEYRSYLNQGTEQQVIQVSRIDQIRKAFEMSYEVSVGNVLNNIDDVILRASYVKYFAASLGYVPRRRPHSDGAIWGRAVMHVLKPRLLFPNKPALPSDSKLTRKYTGLNMAGGARGTSISLGYMAESYIDFGRYMMYLPIFILGVMWGGVYYFFVTRATMNVVGHGFATTVLLNASRFEITTIKLVGGVLSTFIVLALIQTFIVPHVIDWVLRDEEGASV